MSRTLSRHRKPEDTMAPSKLQTTNYREVVVKRLDPPHTEGVFRTLIVLALLFATVLTTDRQATAQVTKRWNTALPFWQNIASWTPLGVPGTNDLALFDINTTDTVTWNAATGNRSTGQLHVLRRKLYFRQRNCNTIPTKSGK